MQGKMLTYKWAINGPYQRQVGNIGLEKDMVVIRFHGGGFKRFRERLVGFEEGVLVLNKIDWLWEKDGHWWLDLDKVRKEHEFVAEAKWLTGVECVKPAFVDDMYAVQFELREEDMAVNKRTRIFLSHKSENKLMVTRFYTVLKEMGFEPWLDRPDMAAGANLARAIQKGFEDSCAAVFFLTPEFKDENYLAKEIDYAVEEKRVKKEKFSVISIDLSKKRAWMPIPALLRPYVVKKMSHELEALYEIIRALPIVSGPPTWRGHLGP